MTSLTFKDKCNKLRVVFANKLVLLKEALIDFLLPVLTDSFNYNILCIGTVQYQNFVWMTQYIITKHIV